MNGIPPKMQPVANAAPYFARRGEAEPFAHPPAQILGDTIVRGATVQAHSIKGAHYPDKLVIFPGAKNDVYVSKTSLFGEKIPMMFTLSKGHDHRDLQRELYKRVFTMGRVFEQGTDEEILTFLKKNAFTYENVKGVKDIIRDPHRFNDEQHVLDMGRVIRYMKGYKSELDTNSSRRKLKAVFERPRIMMRAALRTFRNPDEIGGKGFRTFPITIPAGIALSLISAVIALAYFKYSAHKETSDACL